MFNTLRLWAVRRCAWFVSGAAAVLLTLGAGGCASPDQQPLRVPVSSQSYAGDSPLPKHDKTLLVFLPGRGTTGKDFERQDFISALDHTAASVDAITVDLTFPYYTQRLATKRLHDDIIAPARAQGYRRIWLVGCSMGGLGAIMYTHEHPGEISGIVAIAPYLGEKNVVSEIVAAGGLANWQPTQPLADDDFQRRLWLAIKAERFDGSGRVPLVLGYGTGDRFAYGHRLLAAQLPPDRVFKVFGFHNWATWHQLWRKILASPVSPLATIPTLPTSHAASPASPRRRPDVAGAPRPPRAARG